MVLVSVIKMDLLFRAIGHRYKAVFSLEKEQE